MESSSCGKELGNWVIEDQEPTACVHGIFKIVPLYPITAELKTALPGTPQYCSFKLLALSIRYSARKHFGLKGPQHWAWPGGQSTTLVKRFKTKSKSCRPSGAGV